MKNKKRTLLFPVVLCAAAVIAAGVLWARSGRRSPAPKVWENSIFSWEGEYMLPEYEERINQLMERLDCRAIYQEIPADADNDLVLDFLERSHKNGYQIYYLTGQAQWGLSDGAPMLEELKRVEALNRMADGESGFAGIVWDVEPYVLDAWDEDPEACMEQLVKNCIFVYEQMQRSGMNMIVCIPHFYDHKGFGDALERLIKSGCDAVAVMNYNKNDEAGQIAFEVEAARKYNKGILHITEMQAPGKHDLTENNTYYSDGIDAAAKSHQRLAQTFDYERLGFFWHYLRPLLELSEAESDE